MIYKIKDSVDLFLSGDIITAYFMNTRLKKYFKINTSTIKLLESYDGRKTVYEISQELNLPKNEILNFSKKLEHLKILTKIEKDLDILDDITIKKYNRQLNYFSEFVETVEEAHVAQNKIKCTKFLIFGCGGVGSNIAIQLVMAGAENITLYDYDVVEESDMSRHLYYSEESIGLYKVEALKDYLKEINESVKITVIKEFLTPSTDINSIIEESDFIINTLDEPYIGYTSAKISRICTPLNKPHYIAGGFDAHLASTGELIIPGLTPCVECYATYFKGALKDWKPNSHPVASRAKEIGGLSSMTLFSSSFATIEIIKYITQIINNDESYKTRGELLFKDLSLTYITLDKNPKCKICREVVPII